jgi:hypothetical protein
VRFFTFWEGAAVPTYLQLCAATWFRHMPDLELTVIDYTNLDEWVGDVYDISRLKRLSLSVQSDAISAAVLAKSAGVFLDLDTIILDRPDSFMQELAQGTPVAFGQSPYLHVAVIGVDAPGHPTLAGWMNQAALHLDAIDNGGEWDYMAGKALAPVLQAAAAEESAPFHILDRNAWGNILEAVIELAPGDQETSYRRLYFEPSTVSVTDAIEAAPGRIISLHNSWTPVDVQTATDPLAVLTHDGILGGLLREALGGGDLAEIEARLEPVRSALGGAG